MNKTMESIVVAREVSQTYSAKDMEIAILKAKLEAKSDGVGVLAPVEPQAQTMTRTVTTSVLQKCSACAGSGKQYHECMNGCSGCCACLSNIIVFSLFAAMMIACIPCMCCGVEINDGPEGCKANHTKPTPCTRCKGKGTIMVDITTESPYIL